MDAFTSLPNGSDQRNSGPVSEVDMARGVQEHEIGAGAGGDAADVRTAQCGGAARGGGPERLVGGHAHVPYREGDAERHGRGERGARIAVCGQGDGGTGVEDATGVGPVRTGGELGAGEQCGDGVALSERVEVRFGEVGAVVGRRGVQFDGQLDAGSVAELVGMDPRVQPLGEAGGDVRVLMREDDIAGEID